MVSNGSRAGAEYEYHYEPHLQLEQAYTVRNSQYLTHLNQKRRAELAVTEVCKAKGVLQKLMNEY